MQYFLDTNIFLRYFVDEGNKKIIRDCSLLLKNVNDGKIKTVTSSVVLAEVVWTLGSYYLKSKVDVMKVLSAINSFQIKIINNFNHTVANRIFTEKPVKYIDALIASIPEVQSGQITVISYDKDFDKLGVKRKEPGNLY